MSVAISNRLARRGSAVLAAGLLFGVVPGAVTNAGHAAAPTPTTTTVSPAAATLEEEGAMKVWTVAVSPDSSGSQVKVRLQRLVSGTWFDLFTSTDTLPSGSSYGFQWQGPNGSTLRLGATFLGDGTHAASQSNWSQATWKGKQTDVPAVKITYSASGGTKFGQYRSYKAGGSARLTQTVSPDKSGKKANAHFDKLVGKKWVRVLDMTRTLNAKSTAVYTFKGAPGASYRTYSDYLGDVSNQRAGSAYSYIKFAKVRAKVSYLPAGNRQIGQYKVYKAGAKVNFVGSVSPNKRGQKVVGYLQKLINGKWKPFLKGTKKLSPNSGVVFTLTGGKANAKYRSKLVYGGDAKTAGASSVWRYVRFTK